MERLLMDKIVELEDIIRKMSSNNRGTSPNTKEADNANLSTSTDSTRGVSDNSYIRSDDNVIEEDCNENSKN
uniref:VASP_tetra domain-containing protein n=1 Tax=Strongyloides papillosus TaxID=174720 RepID=A0A0N5B4J6_STREA